ncbi:hypothetical protein SDC9_193148 [bioreactor metagenome]|uniref:Uncharacterized protein n=1 Tax=bioreactor metagenome TaxID=1076179 RepID=A0A645I2Q0_9ZZZZ
MLLVAGVDALGAVAAEEVAVEFHAAVLFDYRDALFLGTSRVDGAFEHHDRAFFKHFSDGFAGAVQRSQVRIVELVHRGWNGNDDHVAVGEHGRI